MVSPKKKIIYISAFLISLLLPIGLIYLLTIFDTKIHSKKDITDLHLPVIGDIPYTEKTEKLLVTNSDRSSVTEAFRILRTNINFLCQPDTSAKVIMITSTISKEGKSFNAVNLAAAYGIANKKTLLMGMDLRSPKLLEYLNLKAADGISDYIINNKIEWKDLVKKLPGSDNVDLLPSGTIPPNPAELLMSDRIRQLFEEAKTDYDYIIVDTAPIGMVADTKMLSNYADVLIYICRLDYLDKRLLTIPKAVYEEKKFKNMSILLNGSKMEHGYGYGYGYGDTPAKEKKSGLLSFFKRAR
jgi:capsular exopolysaccharide synthesis family protein